MNNSFKFKAHLLFILMSFSINSQLLNYNFFHVIYKHFNIVSREMFFFKYPKKFFSTVIYSIIWTYFWYVIYKLSLDYKKESKTFITEKFDSSFLFRPNLSWNTRVNVFSRCTQHSTHFARILHVCENSTWEHNNLIKHFIVYSSIKTFFLFLSNIYLLR